MSLTLYTSQLILDDFKGSIGYTIRHKTELFMIPSTYTQVIFTEDQFTKRGGQLQQLAPGQTIALNKGDLFIIACPSALTVAQVFQQFLTSNGATVAAIIATETSAFDKSNRHPEVPFMLYSDENDRAAYKTCFGAEKKRLLGSSFMNGQHFEHIVDAQNYYGRFIKELTSAHFIAFGTSGQMVQSRLLERNDPSLHNFKITCINWPDEIANPPTGTPPYSFDAYSHVQQKIMQHFTF